MSRAGYTEDCENNWDQIMWRGQVTSAMRGKRGQAFLIELVAALDAMPEKKLIRHELIETKDGAPVSSNVCAIGSVGIARGVELEKIDPYDYDRIATTFGIAHQLVREIEYENDEGNYYKESPQSRWCRVRAWARKNIKNPDASYVPERVWQTPISPKGANRWP